MEAMIHLVGPTAKETLSALYTTRPPVVPRHLLGFFGGTSMRLVNACKHLGVKAVPKLQSQRAQESQHRAPSARQTFRALSPGVFASFHLSKKRQFLGLLQLASQRALYMVQEHGRDTLAARAEPSARHTWPPSGVLLARAVIYERIRCQMLLFAKSLASPPWTLLRQSSVCCILHVFTIMGLTGSGLSFNLRMASNGVNVPS